MSDNTCSICLDPLLSEDQPARSIGTAVPCGHCFHSKCFNRWKASRRSRIRVPCPNCNKSTDDFIKLFISCNMEDMQCLPTTHEEPPKPRKSPSVVVVPLPPRLSSPSRIATQDPPTTPSRRPPTRRSSSNVSSPRAVTRSTVSEPSERRPRLVSPFRAYRVQDNNNNNNNNNSSSISSSNNTANRGAPVISRRRHSSRSLSRMFQLSKIVKDLKVAQQSIVKQVHDHRCIVFTLGTCRQDQQTKRICKLRSSQTRLTNVMEEHSANLEDLPLDSLRRRDRNRVEELIAELETKRVAHREQVELVNTLYTTRLAQERTRVARLRDEQRQLNDTLRDYGAAIKGLNQNHNHNHTNSAGIRLRGRKQRQLTSHTSDLGDAIQSINLGTLERDHVKKVKYAEDELISLVKRVGDHGASIQSLCSMHHFLGVYHEC